MSGKILCLLPRMQDPRIARRIDMLRQAGFQVNALAFERNERPGSGRRPACPTESLGKIPDGGYVLRAPQMAFCLHKVRRALGRHDAIYAFNTDLAVLSIAARVGLAKPLALEIADIAAFQTASRSGRLIRSLERLTVQRCHLLVLTAATYLPYYQAWLKVDRPSLVIENKVDASFAASVRAAGSDACLEEIPAKLPLRLGWFGKLGDEWSMHLVETLARMAPQRFTAVLAGTPDQRIKNFQSRIKHYPNIGFQFGFIHPQGLIEVHRKVFLTLACYPPEMPHGWSQSNRFYDACLFQKPLLVRSGTSDADQVQRYDIGLTIRTADVNRAAAQILDISTADWNRWRTNMAALPPQAYSVSNEVEALQQALRNLITA